MVAAEQAVAVAGAEVERLTSALLAAVGEDPAREGLRDTPGRIARMYEEILSAKPFESTTFPNDGAYDELVVVRDIPFHGTWGPVRAEDVKFGWDQLVLGDSVHGQQTYWKQLMKSFEIVSDKEIIFHLTAPDSQFLTAISEQQGGLEVRFREPKRAITPGQSVVLYDRDRLLAAGWQPMPQRGTAQYPTGGMPAPVPAAAPKPKRSRVPEIIAASVLVNAWGVWWGVARGW